MNVRRSPPGTPSSIEDPQLPPQYRTGQDGLPLPILKRKQPDDLSSFRKELADFRADILSVLRDFTCEQNMNISKIASDISTIKQQIQGIEHKTDGIVLEQNKLKLEIASMKTCSSSTILKISSIENDIKTLQVTTKQVPTTTSQCEDFIVELRERITRERNIIITGIPELMSTSSKERIAYDINEATKVIRMASPDCQEPINCIRLGKFKSGSSRSLKASLISAESAKDVLRNRMKVNTNTVSIFSDKTLQQQKHIKILKEELHARQGQGEENIAIKFIKGVPKIVQLQK